MINLDRLIVQHLIEHVDDILAGQVEDLGDQAPRIDRRIHTEPTTTSHIMSRASGLRTYLYPPQRIVVGEVRQQDCLDLFIALNSGIPGMCTIHANSAREAITKMCTLPLLAGENIGSRFVVPTVAGCVDIVVHLVTEPDGSRLLREIVAVPGRVEGDVVELEPIFAVRGERLVRIDGYPPHAERFERVGIDIAGVLGESPGAGTREGAA